MVGLYAADMEEILSINDLIALAHSTAKSKGWWDDVPGVPSPNFGMLLMLAVTELAEALEEYRDGHELTEIYYGPDGKPEGVPVELADVLIRVFDMSGHYGIPLQDAIRQKMAYNEKRSYRHGGKKA